MEIHAGDHVSLAEIREAGDTAYVRLNFKEFAKLMTAGGDASEADSMMEVVNQVASLDADNPSNAFVALYAGKWVSVDQATVKTLTKQFQGAGDSTGSGLPSAMPSLDPADTTALLQRIGAVLSKDVTVTDNGTKDGVDQLTLTSEARKLVTDLEQAALPTLKKIPGFPTASPLPTPGPTDLPNKVTLDLSVTKGKATKLSMDFAQLDPDTSGDPLPVSLSFTPSASPVSVPSGAVALKSDDLNKFLSSVGGSDDSGLDDSDMPSL